MFFVGSPFVHEVNATGFDTWEFTIEDSTGENDGTNIKIMDGENGYLGDEYTRGQVWNIFLNRYKVFIVAFGAIATLTLVLIGMFLFTKLAAAGSNPHERSQIVKWIGVFFVAAALLGSSTFIFSISYNIFR